jgi:hypothetical protein
VNSTGEQYKYKVGKKGPLSLFATNKSLKDVAETTFNIVQVKLTYLILEAERARDNFDKLSNDQIFKITHLLDNYVIDKTEGSENIDDEGDYTFNPKYIFRRRVFNGKPVLRCDDKLKIALCTNFSFG